ncbi:MAG: recombinase family protein, partial [Sphingobacteriales bacterium]
IIYIRVSTDDQMKGLSPDFQANYLRAFCYNKKIEIIEEIYEDHSAKDFINRPKYQNFYDRLKRKKIKADYFLFTRWDRFSRNLEAHLSVIKELLKLGIEPNAIDNWTDHDDPDQFLLNVFSAAHAQSENMKNSLRTTVAMRTGQRQGRWMSIAPTGYINVTEEDDKFISPCPLKSTLIKEAFSEVASGLYPIEQTWRTMKKKGLAKSKSTFHYMLKNPVYVGKIRIKKWKSEPEEIVNGIHQPLVSQLIFQQVQDRYKPKTKVTARIKEKDSKIYLRGHLICPRCGKALTASASKNRVGDRYWYYHHNDCKIRYNAVEANERFNIYISSFRLPTEVVALARRVVKETISDNTNARAIEMSKINAEIESLKHRKGVAVDRNIDGTFDNDLLKETVQRYNEQISGLEIKQERLRALGNDTAEKIEYTLSLLQNFQKIISDSPVVVKDKLLCSIFPEKLEFDGRNYRTQKMNSAMEIFALKYNELGLYKNEKADISAGLYNEAPPLGLEPKTL